MTLHRREFSLTATGGTPATEDWSLSGLNDGSGLEVNFHRGPLNIIQTVIDDTGVTAAVPTLDIEDDVPVSFSAGAAGTENFTTTFTTQEYRGQLASGNSLFFIGDDLAENDVVRFVVTWEK